MEEAIRLAFDGCPALPKGKRILDWELPVLKAGDRILARHLRLHVTAGERVRKDDLPALDLGPPRFQTGAPCRLYAPGLYGNPGLQPDASGLSGAVRRERSGDEGPVLPRKPAV